MAFTMYDTIARLCAGCGDLPSQLVCIDWLALLYRLTHTLGGGWQETFLAII